MTVIRSYQDLEVWQMAMTLAEDCYRITRAFPREELYGMTSQIRRAAVSIPANIAEGYGREMTGSYIQFLRVSQGSVRELETHLLLAGRINLASGDDLAKPVETCERIGKMLRSLIRALESRGTS
ncbi:MAG: four helix bundle protein [Hyphomicrobium sp.]|nr:four helix bundle protein [Hyphomicrobium sp.]